MDAAQKEKGLVSSRIVTLLSVVEGIIIVSGLCSNSKFQTQRMPFVLAVSTEWNALVNSVDPNNKRNM